MARDRGPVPSPRRPDRGGTRRSPDGAGSSTKPTVRVRRSFVGGGSALRPLRRSDPAAWPGWYNPWESTRDRPRREPDLHDRPPRCQRTERPSSRGDDSPRADAGGVPPDVRRVRLRADRDAAYRADGGLDRQGGRLGRGAAADLRGHQQRGDARRAGLAVRPDGAPGPVRRQAHRRAGGAVQAVCHRLGVPRRAAGQGAVPRVRPVRLRHDRHRERRRRRRDRPGHPRRTRRGRRARLHDHAQQPQDPRRLSRRPGPHRPERAGAPGTRQARQDRSRGRARRAREGRRRTAAAG